MLKVDYLKLYDFRFLAKEKIKSKCSVLAWLKSVFIRSHFTNNCLKRWDLEYVVFFFKSGSWGLEVTFMLVLTVVLKTLQCTLTNPFKNCSHNSGVSNLPFPATHSQSQQNKCNLYLPLHHSFNLIRLLLIYFLLSSETTAVDAEHVPIFSYGGFSLYGPVMEMIASVHYRKCSSFPNFACMPGLLCQFWVDAGLWFCIWVAVFLSSVSQHACWQWAHCLELNSASLSHSSPFSERLIMPPFDWSELKPKPDWNVCLSATTVASPSKFKETCLDLGGGGVTRPHQTAAQFWNLIVCFDSGTPS